MYQWQNGTKYSGGASMWVISGSYYTTEFHVNLAEAARNGIVTSMAFENR